LAPMVSVRGRPSTGSGSLSSSPLPITKMTTARGVSRQAGGRGPRS
jgi:hypothetical protein